MPNKINNKNSNFQIFDHYAESARKLLYKGNGTCKIETETPTATFNLAKEKKIIM